MSVRQELYKFTETWGSGTVPAQVWTFTSGDEPRTHNGELYEPAPLGRSEVESKNELSRASIEIKTDLDSPLGLRWLKSSVEVRVGLTIFERDEDGIISVIWKGRLSSVKPRASEFVLSFESIFTSLRRPGLRARYQRTCRHVLYGRGCLANKDNFAVVGIPTGVSGAIVTVPEAASYPAGWFSAGMIEGPEGELRAIANHSGSSIVLYQPFDPLAKALAEDGYGLSYGKFYGGASVKLYPGCDRNRQTCQEKFGNLPNYGGFDWIPRRNPFDGSSII